ncbi:MAG TPA: class I SAM-dependent methyltransferase, partial [Burkholderiales bacterium]
KEAVNYNRYLLELILSQAGNTTRVIDFGAGSGTFALPTAKSGLEVTAVELDRELRAHLARNGLRAVAGAAELPAASFDFAYTLNVLEHITEDVAALKELRTALLPGARLLVYVPAFPILYTSMDAKVGHVRRYTRATLTRSVAAAGFRIERVEYADSIGFFATLAFRLMDRGTGAINRRMLKLYDRFVFPLSRVLDRLTNRWFGKNLVLVAQNPPAVTTPS